MSMLFWGFDGSRESDGNEDRRKRSSIWFSAAECVGSCELCLISQYFVLPRERSESFFPDGG